MVEQEESTKTQGKWLVKAFSNQQQRKLQIKKSGAIVLHTRELAVMGQSHSLL